MSERPTFWIHRTRRFWMGLTLLILLTTFILIIGYFACIVGYQKSTAPPTAGWPPGRTYHMAGFHSGGFVYHRTNSPFYRMHLRFKGTGKWAFAWEERMGFNLLPQVTFVDHLGLTHDDEPYLFIPLWPLIPLVAAVWITRMFRSEKRELQQYRQDPV
ncbi:MAG: hypothetical protein AAGB14_15365 [Verrucomicrobiota bacterium]